MRKTEDYLCPVSAPGPSDVASGMECSLTSKMHYSEDAGSVSSRFLSRWVSPLSYLQLRFVLKIWGKTAGKMQSPSSTFICSRGSNLGKEQWAAPATLLHLFCWDEDQKSVVRKKHEASRWGVLAMLVFTYLNYSNFVQVLMTLFSVLLSLSLSYKYTRAALLALPFIFT